MAHLDKENYSICLLIMPTTSRKIATYNPEAEIYSQNKPEEHKCTKDLYLPYLQEFCSEMPII